MARHLEQTYGFKAVPLVQSGDIFTMRFEITRQPLFIGFHRDRFQERMPTPRPCDAGSTPIVARNQCGPFVNS